MGKIELVASLRDTLRTATQRQHDELERVAALLPEPTPERYRRFLAAVGSVYPGVDAALLGSSEFCRWLPDAAARSRRAFLAHDLAALGVETRETRLPFGDVGALIGAAYVFEGSTLGGRVIYCALQRHQPHLLVASSFVCGYGDATAARWSAFVEALKRPVSEAAARSAVDGATRTFQALVDELKRR